MTTKIIVSDNIDSQPIDSPEVLLIIILTDDLYFPTYVWSSSVVANDSLQK